MYGSCADMRALADACGVSYTLGFCADWTEKNAAFGVPNSLNVYFVQSSGVLRTALTFANDITDTDVLDVDVDLRDGAWHHYALTVDGNGLTHVWIDGTVEATAHFSGRNSASSTSPMISLP